jgi:hypothetical protein
MHDNHIKFKQVVASLSVFFSIGAPFPTNFIAYSADETTILKTKLTASDVLKSDIEPKVLLLKEVLGVLQKFPSYIESKDYISFRQALREEPAMELRKTCVKLKKYLPSSQIPNFEKAYSDLIETLNNMDYVIILFTFLLVL